MLQFPRNVPGIHNRAKKAVKLMVKHISRNLTYSHALQAFGASPKMETLYLELEVPLKICMHSRTSLFLNELSFLNQCYSVQ